MSAQLDNLLNEGIVAQQAGQAKEALRLFREAYELAPDDAEVMSLLGLALSQSGAFAEAETLLQEAVRLEGSELGFRMNLLTHLINVGSFEQAKDEAVAIIQINPAFPPALERLAEALIALQELEQAQAVLLKLRELNESNPTFFELACKLFIQKRDWQSLEQQASLWTQLMADDALAWQMLCTAYVEQGQLRLAEQHFRKVLDLRQGSARDLAQYAQICLQCFEYDRARQALEKAGTLDSNLAEVQIALCQLHTYHGNFQQALSCARRALELDPGNVEAFRQLVNVSRGKIEEHEFTRLLTLTEQLGEKTELAVDCQFSLARVYEARKEYAQAFSSYEKANSLNRQLAAEEGQAYEPKTATEKIQAIRGLFNSDKRSSSQDRLTPCPIFIVGMPRSGTTLVEATLTAHSLVTAGGERPLLPQILNQKLAYASAHDHKLPDNQVLEEWSNIYVSDHPELGSATHFTDKNPINFEALGLANILFANAPLIHVRRNPLDTCLSIYKHKFSRFWPFSHCLNDIAHFYAQYAGLMAHWQALLGSRLLTVQYEEFANDFTSQAPGLLAHCGLEWEEGCLQFQQGEQAIATLSAVQIRDKVKVKNTALANYQEHLQPLQDALQQAGVNLQTGALTDQQ